MTTVTPEPGRAHQEAALPPVVALAATGGSAMRPFLIGTAVGGVTGAVAGTMLSQATRRLLVGLIHLVGRRLTDDERDELRFELLLQ